MTYSQQLMQSEAVLLGHMWRPKDRCRGHYILGWMKDNKGADHATKYKIPARAIMEKCYMSSGKGMGETLAYIRVAEVRV